MIKLNIPGQSTPDQELVEVFIRPTHHRRLSQSGSQGNQDEEDVHVRRLTRQASLSRLSLNQKKNGRCL